MRYSKLIWSHAVPDEPIEILSEHDDAGWERRKIELFRDGSMGFASATERAGGSELSLIQCPADEAVNQEPEFRVVDINRDEFESAWNQAHHLVKSA